MRRLLVLLFAIFHLLDFAFALEDVDEGSWYPGGSFIRRKNPSEIRFLAREEPNNHLPCQPHDLTDACPDESVVATQLEDKCKGLHSLSAAKCYMEYLCDHHNQATVNSHKPCLNEQCPLAKRMPPLNCTRYAARKHDAQHQQQQDQAGADHHERDPKPQQQTEAPKEETTTTTTTTATEAPKEDEKEQGEDEVAQKEKEEQEETEYEKEAEEDRECNIHNLVDSCPDDSVNQYKLENEYCDNKEGSDAAICYMEYLCVYHNQDVVTKHKKCLDTQCSLVALIPPLDCASWEVAPKEREEGNHNAGCTISDLADACAGKTETSVDAGALHSECQQSLSGIPAAKCYMGYLCDYHNQEAVIRHKKCLDSQCPLAHHLPPLNCTKWTTQMQAQKEKYQAAAAASNPTEDTTTTTTTTTTKETEEEGDSGNTSGGGGIGLRLILLIVVVVAVGGLYMFFSYRDRRRYTQTSGNIVLQNLHSTQLELSDHEDDDQIDFTFTNGENPKTTVYRD